MMMKKLAFLAALSVHTSASTLAPYLAGGENAIENDYIVHFHANHTQDLHHEAIGKDLSQHEHFKALTGVPGYRAVLDNHTLHELVRHDPGVKLVEENARLRMIKPVYRSEPFQYESSASNTAHSKRWFKAFHEINRSWNLRMISKDWKVSVPAEDGTYDVLGGAGQGVNVYVFDTGIYTGNTQFEGRAKHFGGLQSGDTSPYCDAHMWDDDGHGTHVAGIIGSMYHGVARYVNLINVKVLPPDWAPAPRVDNFAQAIIDVTAEHNANKANDVDGTFRGSIINLSLGGPLRSSLVDDAIWEATDAGITIVGAAGNDNEDASRTFPCNSARIICVGSIDRNYTRAIDSNYGLALHINAPGEDIASTSKVGSGYAEVLSGTSQAAPHVAGMAAIWMSWEAITGDTNLPLQRLLQNQLENVLTDLYPGTPNKLATTGIHHRNKEWWQPYVNAPAEPALGGSSKAVMENAVAFKSPNGTNIKVGPTATGDHATTWETDTTTWPESTLTAVDTTEPTLRFETTSTGIPIPTSKMAIAYTYSWDWASTTSAVFWNFYAAPYDATAFETCLPSAYSTITTPLTSPTVTESVQMPSGTFALGSLGDVAQHPDCTYVANGDDSGGTFTFSDDGPTIECENITGDDATDANCSGGDDTFNTFAWKVACYW